MKFSHNYLVFLFLGFICSSPQNCPLSVQIQHIQTIILTWSTASSVIIHMLTMFLPLTNYLNKKLRTVRGNTDGAVTKGCFIMRCQSESKFTIMQDWRLETFIFVYLEFFFVLGGTNNRTAILTSSLRLASHPIPVKIYALYQISIYFFSEFLYCGGPYVRDVSTTKIVGRDVCQSSCMC